MQEEPKIQNSEPINVEKNIYKNAYKSGLERTMEILNKYPSPIGNAVSKPSLYEVSKYISPIINDKYNNNIIVESNYNIKSSPKKKSPKKPSPKKQKTYMTGNYVSKSARKIRNKNKFNKFNNNYIHSEDLPINNYLSEGNVQCNNNSIKLDKYFSNNLSRRTLERSIELFPGNYTQVDQLFLYQNPMEKEEDERLLYEGKEAFVDFKILKIATEFRKINLKDGNQEFIRNKYRDLIDGMI